MFCCVARHQDGYSSKLRLPFYAYANGAGVVVEMLVPNHRPEIDKRLHSVGQDQNSPKAQIKEIPDWCVILEFEL